MQTVSATFLAAIRTFHSMWSTATFTNPFTGTTTDLPIKTGSTVTVDVTAKNRRMLNLVLPPEQGLYNTLLVPGGEITVTQTFRYIDHSTETIPLGVFCVDSQDLGYRVDGQLQATCPDRWVRVQRNRFGLNRSSIPTNAGWQEIKRLVEGAWPNSLFPFPGWSHIDTSATTHVGGLVWDDGDRETAILALAATGKLDVYFDADGQGVLTPLPQPTTGSAPVWTVDSSASGVFLDGDRKLDLSTVRNAVIVSSSASDIILTPVEVKNTHDPVSDPLSTLGPLGYVPAYYSSAVIRTTGQATNAGKTILQQQLQAAQQVSLTAIPNPALEGWDVLLVVYPPSEFGTSRPSDIQILESTTIPLTPDGTQTITLRSTLANADPTT